MCEPESDGDREADVTAPESKRSGSALRWMLLVVFGSLVASGVWAAGGGRVAAWLIEREDVLETWAAQNTMLAGLVALGVYVVVAGLSVPVATLLSLATGRILGFWPALFVVSFGSTIGATLAMVVARTLLRESVVKRLGAKGQGVLANFERNGTFYLYTLRMMPQVPFVLVNLAMGLSPIRVWSFFWISQVGMLPATALFVFTGSELPSLKAVAQGDAGEILSWPLIAGLVLLGVFPLAVRLCWPSSVGEEAEGDVQGEAR
jgi:uncharacterized membrane protein YdjX (TVP38/TMEM64 family)